MNKTDNKEINKRVRELREMKKLTQKEFGENINVTREAISSIENGSNNLTERNLKSICDFYNVNEEWLRHGEGAVFKKKIDYKAKAKQNLWGYFACKIFDFYDYINVQHDGKNYRIHPSCIQIITE